MAADPLAAERAYDDIKRALMHSRFRLAERLDVLTLADGLGLSATPVREALSRLAFERLVRFEPKRGYFARLWSEQELRALYEWRGAICVLGLASGGEAQPASEGDYPRRVRALLAGLNANANPELIAAAANADDRLELARAVEPGVLGDVESELKRLAELAADAGQALARTVRHYHARRMRHAEDIRAAAVLRAVGDNGR